MKRRSWLNLRFLGFLGFLLLVVVPLGITRGPSSAFFAFFTLLEVMLLFNVLIIVHELGHFLAARWRGLKVDKFAIWFGKPIWTKTVDGVEYILGSIPAGGYVALPQMAPMETIEGKTETPREELPPASPGNKIIVALGGTALQFPARAVLRHHRLGRGQADDHIPRTRPRSASRCPTVRPTGQASGTGTCSRRSTASRCGAGTACLMAWSGASSPVRTGPSRSRWNAPDANSPFPSRRKSIRTGRSIIGGSAASHRRSRSRPRRKASSSARSTITGPASLAGLREGDQLTALEGVPLLSSGPIGEALKDHPDAPLHLTVLRGGGELGRDAAAGKADRAQARS